MELISQSCSRTSSLRLFINYSNEIGLKLERNHSKIWQKLREIMANNSKKTNINNLLLLPHKWALEGEMLRRDQST